MLQVEVCIRQAGDDSLPLGIDGVLFAIFCQQRLVRADRHDTVAFHRQGTGLWLFGVKGMNAGVIQQRGYFSSPSR